jgi:hypothetical protein
MPKTVGKKAAAAAARKERCEKAIERAMKLRTDGSRRIAKRNELYEELVHEYAEVMRKLREFDKEDTTAEQLRADLQSVGSEVRETFKSLSHAAQERIEKRGVPTPSSFDELSFDVPDYAQLPEGVLKSRYYGRTRPSYTEFQHKIDHLVECAKGILESS